MVFTALVFRNSHSLKTRIYFWTSAVPNFTQTWQAYQMGKISSTPLSEVWLSLHRFSRNPQMRNGMMWKDPVSNFTRIGLKKWNVCVYKFIYTLMYDFSWDHLHETHASSTPFCKESFTELYKNMTNILTSQILLSETEERTVHTRKASVLLNISLTSHTLNAETWRSSAHTFR